jgi:hypothetical protein
MEPRREKPKAPKPRPEEKQKRFRLIKLEERIAPSGGGGGRSNKCVNDSNNQGYLSIE